MCGRQSSRLTHVSLSLSNGVTAVMGASGAGKTSLLNLLAGYEQPSCGKIHNELSVAWVPSGFGLWPGCRAHEHVADAHLLEILGLGDCRDAFPHTLSLGQQARLSVARALASSAQLLIMDEPLAHVDPRHRSDFWNVIRGHLGERVLVFASHEPETVLAHASEVCCLVEGEIVYHGETMALYERPETSELAHFLGRTNWLDSDDQRCWLGGVGAEAQSVRPEHLEVLPSAGGNVRCLSSQNLGLYAESCLRNEETGDERVFLHRSTASVLTGVRVAVQWLALLMVCLNVMACGKESTIPVIPVSEFRAWPLPIDGPKLPSPRSVATGLNDDIVVLDDAGRVLVFGSEGKVLRRWSMPDVTVGRPEGVVVLGDGKIVVCDTHYSQVLVFSPEGEVLREFGQVGRGDGEFIYPVAIARDSQNCLYIGEYGSNDRIQKFTADGKHLLTFGSFGTEPGQFQRPSGIVWHEGVVYVADAVNNRVQRFQDDGTYTGELTLTHAGKAIALHLPYDLALDGQGQLVVVEYGAGRVLSCTLDGNLIGAYGRQGSGMGQFHTPWGVTVDSRGHLRVADTGNRRLVAMKVGL